MPSKNEVYPDLSEVLMSTFGFDNLLEGLMEFRKAVILTVYYRQMLQTKISKGKRHRGQSPGDKFLVILFQRSDINRI